MKGCKDQTFTEHKEWRVCFARDNYTCVWCGAVTRSGLAIVSSWRLTIIKSWTDYPELRYEVTNGRTM